MMVTNDYSTNDYIVLMTYSTNENLHFDSNCLKLDAKIARYLNIIISFLVVTFLFCLSNNNVKLLSSFYLYKCFLYDAKGIYSTNRYTQILTVIHL